MAVPIPHFSRPPSPASTAPAHAPHRLYQGHRRNSWVVAQDVDTVVELRARQRTFDGNLGYALFVLKIFSPDFAKIGLVYVILAILLSLIAHFRRRRSDHDFADSYRPPRPEEETRKKASERLWGTRGFRTSGDVVALIGVVCGGLYVALFVLVMRLGD
ncbi:hypothetical protein JCM8097_002085 [Rhodosporidiobolus ruineniae]